MPSAYTHHLVAHRVFSTLPTHIQKTIRPHLGLYFFGAQGADFCFFYKFLPGKRKNLGSYLHRKGGYEAFRLLKNFSVHDSAALAYALGYITHYAVDVRYHPSIYAVAGKDIFRHSYLENALDKYYRKRYFGEDNRTSEEFFRKTLTATEEKTLFFIYAAFASRADYPPLIENEFLGAVKLFNAYLPASYSFFNVAYAKLKTLPPPDPTTAENLLLSAVSYAETLFSEFLHAIETQSPLSRETFGKNYLNGK